MDEIKSKLLIIFLPITLFVSCNGGGSMYIDGSSDRFKIPMMGGEAAEQRENLKKDYSELCEKLNNDCTTIDQVLDCKTMQALVEMPVCPKEIGALQSKASGCSCNDLCNPDKISRSSADNLAEGINLLKDPEISSTLAYAGLKAISARSEFNPNPPNSSPKLKKLDALKIIDSMESGEFLGKINSFSSPSEFVKFTMGNELLKDRFLRKLKSQPKPQIASKEFDPTNVNVGDFIASGYDKYIIESQGNGKCIRKIGDTSCEGNIVGTVEKLSKPTLAVLKYDEATKFKLTTSCIQKTNCNGTTAPSQKPKQKLEVSFDIKPGFAPSIQEKLPAAVECMKTIPTHPLFAAKVKEIYGAQADGILQKISTNKNFMNIRPYIARPSVLASTDTKQEMRINNLNTSRSSSGLTGTIFHEWLHTIPYLHGDRPKPDVAYTLGDLASEMADKNYCDQ